MQEVKKYLLAHQDDKYKLLNNKLNIANNIKSLGVRIPLIRSYAKNLAQKYSLNYLVFNIDEEYYEELLLKGFIIGNYKNLTLDELLFYINGHLPKISDWSMCDTFVSSLKITKKYLAELWPFLLDLINSKKEFYIRFALVMMLNYYINDNYKKQLFNIISSIQNNEYYVKMANAWLLSYMIIAYYDESLLFIKTQKIDYWTVCKGITKAIESHKINSERKEFLRSLRNSINNK